MKDYKDNDIWLMNGDCLERMKEVADGSVDLVLTDPPYKMTKRGKSCRPNWMPNNMGENVFDGEVCDFESWLSLVYTKMTPDSQMYVFTNTVSLQELLNCATKVGFKLHNILTMIKDTNMPNRWYLKQCELVLFMRKGKAYPINDMTSKDWFHCVMPRKGDGKLHITQKPIEPLIKFITNSTDEGDLVLDIFMGSGTTGVSARKLNRKFIGIEMDEGYFSIAKERILTV